MKRIDEIMANISTARSLKESGITLDDVKLVIDEVSKGKQDSSADELKDMKVENRQLKEEIKRITEENEKLKDKVDRLTESNKQLMAQKKAKGTAR